MYTSIKELQQEHTKTRKHTLSHGVQGNLNIYIEYNIEFKQKQEIIHKTQIIIQKYLSIHNATMTPNLAL